MHEVCDFLPGRHSCEQGSEQSSKESKHSSPVALIHRELRVRVDPDVTVNKVGGEAVIIAQTNKTSPKSTPSEPEHPRAGIQPALLKASPFQH